MTEYNHILLVRSETADKISGEMVKNAGRYGVGIIVCGKDGLEPLSEGLPQEEIKRLNTILPKGMNAAKGNHVLHRLNYRLKSLANRQTSKEQNEALSR